MGKLRELAPWLRPYAEWLYLWAQGQGYKPTVTSVYRSIHQQRVLYERYRRGLSEIPAAPPGRSFHQHRMAFDMVVRQGYRSKEQRELGELWRRMGGRWYEADPVHFEVRPS